MIGEKSNRICIVLYSVWHDSCTDPALCRAGDFSDPVISFSGISSVLLLNLNVNNIPDDIEAAICLKKLIMLIITEKDLHKGTSAVPVLPESKRKCCSKVSIRWTRTKRERFPVQTFSV